MSQLQSMLMKPLVAVAPDDTLALAVELMECEKVGAVVVVQQARPVGIITDRDIALALGARGATTDDWVQKYMTCPVTTMRQDEGIYSATQYMMENALRRVPVVDDAGTAIGLVS
jgi:CBS domain-containing protein